MEKEKENEIGSGMGEAKYRSQIARGATDKEIK
jgi:hypothetical protein